MRLFIEISLSTVVTEQDFLPVFTFLFPPQVFLTNEWTRLVDGSECVKWKYARGETEQVYKLGHYLDQSKQTVRLESLVLRNMLQSGLNSYTQRYNGKSVTREWTLILFE